MFPITCGRYAMPFKIKSIFAIFIQQVNHLYFAIFNEVQNRDYHQDIQLILHLLMIRHYRKFDSDVLEGHEVISMPHNDMT